MTENHILNSFNPILGKVFDFQATLPQDETLGLTISVMHRAPSAYNLIRKTTVDHATCGLSQSFAVCIHMYIYITYVLCFNQSANHQAVRAHSDFKIKCELHWILCLCIL